MFAQKIVWGVSCKRWFADEQFVKHATERIDIAARIKALAADLLGGHIGASPFHLALSAEEFAKSGFRFLRDGEVDEFYQSIAIDEDIVGLDIAVNVALAVEVVEGFADLFDDGGEHVRDRFGAFSHRLFQVDFAEEFKDDEGGIRVGDVFNQLDDVLVVEVASDFIFVFEECDFLFVAPLFGPKNFEGIVVPVVFDSFPDLASASEADQSGQSVWPQKVSNFNHENPAICLGMAPPSPALPRSGKRKTLRLEHSPAPSPAPQSVTG